MPVGLQRSQGQAYTGIYAPRLYESLQLLAFDLANHLQSFAFIDETRQFGGWVKGVGVRSGSKEAFQPLIPALSPNKSRNVEIQLWT